MECRYSKEELDILKDGAERQASLLELQTLISRSLDGIVKKFDRLSSEYPQTWKKEWFARYTREIRKLDPRKKRFYIPKKEGLRKWRGHEDSNLFLGACLGYNLLELGELLKRPPFGILQRIERLARHLPQVWERETVRGYYREYYRLRSEQIAVYRNSEKRRAAQATYRRNSKLRRDLERCLA